MRAFAGLASAPTEDARVDLVMEDLERLGAFERSVLCVASPTGSGYVNYVAVETLEYLTRGDCATVALQYSLRPSFLSLDRVAMGREQNRALFHALSWRLRAMPEDRRPRLVGFGESLGAHTIQDAFLYEGVAGLHRVGHGPGAVPRDAGRQQVGQAVAAGPRAHRPGRRGRRDRRRTRSGWRCPRRPGAAPGTSCCPTTRTRSPGSSPRWPCSSRTGWARGRPARPGCPGTPAGTRSRRSSSRSSTPRTRWTSCRGRSSPAGTTTGPTWPGWSASRTGCRSTRTSCCASSARCAGARRSGRERRLVAEQLQRAREAVQREVSTWGIGKDAATWDDDAALPSFG